MKNQQGDSDDTSSSDDDDPALNKQQSEFLRRATTAFDPADLNWDNLTWSDKSKFFNGWSLVVIMANAISLIGTVFFLADPNNPSNNGYGEFFIGIGTCIQYISFMQYTSFYSGYNTISDTMVYSTPLVTKALVGILPVFCGYTFLGITTFWKSKYFQGFAQSQWTLFAIMNGDAIYDIYVDLSGFEYFFA